jgi:hypothetical protein
MRWQQQTLSKILDLAIHKNTHFLALNKNKKKKLTKMMTHKHTRPAKLQSFFYPPHQAFKIVLL